MKKLLIWIGVPVIVLGITVVGWRLAGPQSAVHADSTSEFDLAEARAAARQRQMEATRLRDQGIIPPAMRENKSGGGAVVISDLERQAQQRAKPTLRTSLLNLDLSRPPTERELIEAGQLGDPLSPTAPADPTKYSDPAMQALRSRDNLAFGRAIQTWNEHKYAEAVKMFAQHITEFPDSPWVAESKLHIGCSAQYNGEYDVCYEQFSSIVEATPKGSDVNQKAQLRLANIMTMQGRFEEAAQAYVEALKREADPKRAGYASSWLPTLSLFKQQQTAMRDCVQKSLREICLMRGQPADAERVAALPAMRADGFTVAQVIDVCRDIGITAQAVRVTGKDASVLRAPFLAHYTDEHFVAVLRVSGDKVRLFDSRVGFQNEIPLASFKAQWSGSAISLTGAEPADPRIAALSTSEMNTIIGGCCGVMPQNAKLGGPGENSPCATGPIQLPDDGSTPPTGDPKTLRASPGWWVNQVSFNMVVRDVPIWWDSPYGLDVNFSLTYNSQDNLNTVRPLGAKWTLNYGAYAMEDPSGHVTIVAGNGNQWGFDPTAGGGYTAPTDFPCVLVKTGTYEFELTDQETDTVYRYGRPAGVSTSASLFLSATDKWGVSVTMTHNANAALTAVTHSIGGTWNVIYNAAGLVERVDDPFGRSAYFAYDTPGMLREVTDMGGLRYSFKYSTSADPVNATTTSETLLTEIVYAPQEVPLASERNRTWHPLTYRFFTEPADGLTSGMWGRYRITITHPTEGKEVYYFSGLMLTAGSHQTPAQVAAANPGTAYTFAIANGEGHIAGATYPAGGISSLANFNSAGVPLTSTSRDGVVTTMTVNSFERPLTVTDPASRVTTFEYDTNGMDLKKVTGPDNVVAVQITYNAQRLPIEVLARDGTKTTATYNAQGQPLTWQFLDANGAVAHSGGNTYNGAGQVTSVQLDGRTTASFTYDALGRVLTSTDEEGSTTTFVYDALNRVTKVTAHDGRSSELGYYGITGMVAWERGRGGQMTQYFYDRRGQKIGVRVPGQRFLGFSYDADGHLTQLIDSNANITRFEYDIEGRLLKKIMGDGSTITNTWNTKSQLTQQVSPRGLKNVLAYDTLGRVTGISYLDAANATMFPALGFTYDILDRTATTTDGEGTTTYAYDTAARLQSVDGPYANDTVSYTFDAQSRADTVTTPGGVTQSFGFDADGRLSSWTDVFGSGSMTYSGHTGRVLGVSRAGGLLTTSVAYTAVTDLQKLAQIKHESGGSVVSQFDYTWSAQQDLATWTRKLGSTADRETRYEFAHDAAHQLTAATLKQTSNSAVVADGRWGVDSIGNRILEHDLVTGIRTEFRHTNTNALIERKVYSNNQKPWVQGSVNEPSSVAIGGKPVTVKGNNTFQGQAPSRTTTINATDAAGNPTNENWQLNNGSGATPDSTTTFTHDAEGNLLGDGTSTFEWDLKNRLTAIVTGTHRTEYTYDGADRRVRVIEKDIGTVTSDKRRVYYGLSLLEERAADNTTVLRRFYGGGQVDVAGSGKRYAYTTDHLGSIREVMLLDGTSGNPTTATLTARYDYDAWGKRTVLDGGTPAETLTLSGYTGHEYHKPSGLWLAPFRAYSPALGRWISRDPIGEAGGINLFAYVSNAPDVATDPLGWCSSGAASGGGAGGANGAGAGGAVGASDPWSWAPDWLLNALGSPRVRNANNAMAGAAAVLSLGSSNAWMSLAGADGHVDKDSTAYKFGTVAGAVMSVKDLAKGGWNWAAGGVRAAPSSSLLATTNRALWTGQDGKAAALAAGRDILTGVDGASISATNLASAVFAAEARGTVEVFVGKGVGNTFWNHELPQLLANARAGLVKIEYIFVK